MDKSKKFDAMRWSRSLRTSELTAPERSVGWALALRAGATGQCWPSVQTLANDTSLSTRTVQRALRVLVEGGWVEVKEARPGFTPDYRLREEGGDTQSGVGVSHSQGRGDCVSGEGCHTVRGGVTHSHPKLCIEEPIEEKKEDAREALSFSDEGRAQWQAALGELVKAWTQEEG